MYSERFAQLYARTTEGVGCIGRASNIRRFCARSNLAKEIAILELLAQLEVSGEKFSVALFESVAKCLNCVSIDECASCFTFSVNCRSNSINVAIGCTDSIFDTIEAIFHSIVNSIEAVAYAISNSTKLSIVVLCVKTFVKVSTS